MIKSSLKWAGSKQPIIENVKSAIESLGQYDCLVEPFFGAGNVSLNIPAKEYILSDSNHHLVNYHNCVIECPEELISISRELFQKTTEDDYYHIRDQFNNGRMNIIERSAMFLYLNKYGFNGLCRFNKKGLFNVPWCRSEKMKPVPENEIMKFSERFQDINILSDSFQETILYSPDNSVIYCDPPYVPLDGSQNVGMYANSFGFDEQESLKTLCKESKNRCLISNHWTDYTEELYSDADDLIIFDVRRTISRDAGGRVPVKEVIAIYK